MRVWGSVRAIGGAAGAWLRRATADRQGVTAVVVALSATAVLGFAGLAVDVGLWYSDKRTLQGVADLAANAAAVTDKAGGETTTSQANGKAAAYAVAAAHGFVNGANGVSVVVNNKPLNGSYTNSYDAFEVIITKPEPLFFSILYMNPYQTVSAAARAVGAVKATTTTSTSTQSVGPPGCFAQLGSGTSKATMIGNGANLTLNGCAYTGNGSGTSSTGVCSLSMTGGAKITTSNVTLVGGSCSSNGATIVNSSNATVTPVTGASSFADPYGGLTLAQVEATSYYNMPSKCSSSGTANFSSWGATVTTAAGTYGPNNTGANNAPTYNNGTYTINPGVYCGGISVSNGIALNFNPGVYYIMGGQFTLNSGANLAAGVTIVLVDYNGSPPTLTMGNGATLNISSPTSGPTAGIAFYGDPANTGTVEFNGGFNMTLNGALYFPGSAIRWDNGATINAANSNCTEVIGSSFNIQGGMNLNMNGCGTGNYGVKSVTETQTVTTTTTTYVASVVE